MDGWIEHRWIKYDEGIGQFDDLKEIEKNGQEKYW